MTKEERDALDRYHIEKAYCLPISPELARLDDDGLFPKLRLFYFLGMGREYLPQRDKAVIDMALEHGNGKLWLPDIPRNYLGGKVAALEALNIPALIADPDREFRGSDPELVAWFERAIHCRRDIKKFLGVSLSPASTPIKTLKTVLGTIGVTLKMKGRDKVNGKAGDRIYGIVPHGNIEISVLAAWIERDTPQVDPLATEPPQTQTGQGVGDVLGSGSASEPDPLAVIDLIYKPLVDPDPDPIYHPHYRLLWGGTVEAITGGAGGHQTILIMAGPLEGQTFPLTLESLEWIAGQYSPAMVGSHA